MSQSHWQSTGYTNGRELFGSPSVETNIDQQRKKIISKDYIERIILKKTSVIEFSLVLFYIYRSTKKTRLPIRRRDVT